MLDARGLADELLKTGSRPTGLRLFGNLSLDLSRLRSRFPFVLITPQYAIEHLLERRALSAEVHFRHGTELTGLHQSADEVTAEVQEADGTRTTLSARYAVGTDGVRSAVREALGLPFPGKSVIRSIILADVRPTEEPAALLTANGAGDAFAFIAPLGDGRYRVMGWNPNHQADDTDPVELREIVRVARIPSPGSRAPDLGLVEGRLQEVLRDGEFVLVTPADTPTPESPASLVHTHWTDDRSTVLLVRPDGHVAWASDRPDPAGLRAALTR